MLRLPISQALSAMGAASMSGLCHARQSGAIPTDGLERYKNICSGASDPKHIALQAGELQLLTQHAGKRSALKALFTELPHRHAVVLAGGKGAQLAAAQAADRACSGLGSTLTSNSMREGARSLGSLVLVLVVSLLGLLALLNSRNEAVQFHVGNFKQTSVGQSVSAFADTLTGAARHVGGQAVNAARPSAQQAAGAIRPYAQQAAGAIRPYTQQAVKVVGPLYEQAATVAADLGQEIMWRLEQAERFVRQRLNLL